MTAIIDAWNEHLRPATIDEIERALTRIFNLTAYPADWTNKTTRQDFLAILTRQSLPVAMLPDFIAAAALRCKFAPTIAELRDCLPDAADGKAKLVKAKAALTMLDASTSGPARRSTVPYDSAANRRTPEGVEQRQREVAEIKAALAAKQQAGGTGRLGDYIKRIPTDD